MTDDAADKEPRLPALAGPLDVLVGRRLAQERTAQGLSARALARQASMQPLTLQLAEAGCGRLSALQFYRLLKALNRSPAWLFKDWG